MRLCVTLVSRAEKKTCLAFQILLEFVYICFENMRVTSGACIYSIVVWCIYIYTGKVKLPISRLYNEATIYISTREVVFR